MGRPEGCPDLFGSLAVDTMGVAAWAATAFAILITGISKAGLGGALGGLAVPVMSIWMSPRDAVAVVLPILIAMDCVGMRAWRGKAARAELGRLIPSALIGIAAASALIGLLSDQAVKAALGAISVAFVVDRLVRRGRPQGVTRAGWAWLSGAGAGFTSTFAHAGGPPLMMYLLGRALSRETFVATSVFFFAAINAAKLPFYIGLGLFSRDTLTMSLVLLPLVPLGVWLGTRLLARIPERPFYLFATTMLGLAGVQLLWDAVSG